MYLKSITLLEPSGNLAAEVSAAGPAMVEFRQSESTGEFVLMEINGKFWGSEINGKFWGSLELSLAAGVNFAADLIRLQRGETLAFDRGFERNCEFYGPWTEIS